MSPPGLRQRSRATRNRRIDESAADHTVYDKQFWTAARSAIALAGARDRAARWGIAALTLCFGAIALVSTTTPDGTEGSLARTVVALPLACSTIPVAMAMTRMRIGLTWWSREADTHSPLSLNDAFVAYADIGIVIGLLALKNSLLPLYSSVLFAVIGGYVAHFVRPRVMYAHIVFSSFTIVGLGVAASYQGVAVGTAVYCVAIAFIASNGIVLVLHSYSVAFKQALLRTQLNCANTDPLTGVLNRRGFSTAATRFFRSGRPVTLIMVDVDRFKEINDNHGHSVGDAILTRLATRIADIAGPDAATGRLGGDEFRGRAARTR